MHQSLENLNDNHHRNQLNAFEIQLQTTDDRLKKEDKRDQKNESPEIRENQEKHEEHHLSIGEYLKSIVYAGLDGTINSLVVIFSGIASGADSYKVLSLVISLVIGDALSMSLGDYLSAKAENQYIKCEAEREFYEAENMLDKEKAQIIEIYQEKKYTREQSERLADLYSTNLQAFVNIMMLQELGLVVSDAQEWKNGVATFISFIIFGILPSIPYIITAGIIKNDSHHSIACALIGVVMFFSIGIAKARLIGVNLKTSIITGFEVLIIGAATVAIGYGIGVAFQ